MMIGLAVVAESDGGSLVRTFFFVRLLLRPIAVLGAQKGLPCRGAAVCRGAVVFVSIGIGAVVRGVVVCVLS